MGLKINMFQSISCVNVIFAVLSALSKFSNNSSVYRKSKASSHFKPSVFSNGTEVAFVNLDSTIAM